MRARERVLDLLQQEYLDGVTAADLAEEGGLTVATVRQVLRELERAGLAYSRPPVKWKKVRVRGKVGGTLISYKGRGPRTAREWRAR